MKKITVKIIAALFAFSMLLTLASCFGEKEDLVKIIDIKLTDEEYAFVVKKGNTELVESMNAFMEQIKKDGTFDTIVAKYFEGVGEKVGYTVSNDDVQNTDNNFVVVTNCPFAPFEYMESDGKIYGLDIEIAAAYADYAGLELVIKDIGFSEIFLQVEAGYADIGMAGITVDAERSKVYDFTTPYYQASQKLIVAADNTDFDGCETAEDVERVLASLTGKKIGYQSATTGGMYITGDEDWGFEGFSNIDGKSYATAQIAVTDLINGNLYAVIVDEAPASAIVSALNE